MALCLLGEHRMIITTTLSPEELDRYREQIKLKDVGLEGQLMLKQSSVAIVGLGGLGSPVTLYLAAAGVGRMTLIENDTVALPNLHRQVLFDSGDVGSSKLEAASRRFTSLNPDIRITEHHERLDSNNATTLLQGNDLVLDCTDNFESRYIINSVGVSLGIPVVFGSVFRSEGQVSVFGAGDGPCYQCLYPEVPNQDQAPSCADDGVLGVLPGVIGMLQATEALKLILGIGEALVGKLILYDALRMEFRTIQVKRNPNCPVCATRTSKAREASTSSRHHTDLAVEEYANWRNSGYPHQLIDIREEYESDIASIGGKLIPMEDLLAHMEDISRSEPIVLYCHLGIRSRKAATMLAHLGFDNVYDLIGGINRWSERIDSSVPRY